jgi:hypothetical protein
MCIFFHQEAIAGNKVYRALQSIQKCVYLNNKMLSLVFYRVIKAVIIAEKKIITRFFLQ